MGCTNRWHLCNYSILIFPPPPLQPESCQHKQPLLWTKQDPTLSLCPRILTSCRLHFLYFSPTGELQILPQVLSFSLTSNPLSYFWLNQIWCLTNALKTPASRSSKWLVWCLFLSHRGVKMEIVSVWKWFSLRYISGLLDPQRSVNSEDRKSMHFLIALKLIKKESNPQKPHLFPDRIEKKTKYYKWPQETRKRDLSRILQTITSVFDSTICWQRQGLGCYKWMKSTMPYQVYLSIQQWWNSQPQTACFKKILSKIPARWINVKQMHYCQRTKRGKKNRNIQDLSKMMLEDTVRNMTWI